MARAKQPRGRVSPTEALHILMTRMAPPAAAKRLTAALHNYDCHLWSNGKPAHEADVAHLSVLDNYDDTHPDRWYATIGDDRWDAVRAEYEFNADEVRALLSEQLTDPLAPTPRRRGRATTHDWFSICGEIARRCHDPKTGRVQIPKSENKLAKDVLTWLEENERGEPSVSEMREAVKRVCAALREVQK